MKNVKIFVLLLLSTVLLSSVAFAQTAAGTSAPTPPSFGEVLNRMVPMFVVVFFIFYFLVMKPQQAKLKSQQKLLNELKRGDQVTTSSGIIGRVAAVEKGYILLEVAPNTRIRVETAHVLKKYEEPVEVLAADKKAS